MSDDDLSGSLVGYRADSEDFSALTLKAVNAKDHVKHGRFHCGQGVTHLEHIGPDLAGLDGVLTNRLPSFTGLLVELVNPTKEVT